MVVSVGIAPSIFLLMYNMQHGGQCRSYQQFISAVIRMRHGGQCCSYHQFISAASMYTARWPVLGLLPFCLRCNYVCSKDSVGVAASLYPLQLIWCMVSVGVATNIFPLHVCMQHGGQCLGLAPGSISFMYVHTAYWVLGCRLFIFASRMCLAWQSVFGLLTCLICLRRRTRSITNEWSPRWSILCYYHGITQGHLSIFDDLVSPAEWGSSSWAAPWWRWGGGQNVHGLCAGV